jgi:hypothetical protein
VIRSVRRRGVANSGLPGPAIQWDPAAVLRRLCTEEKLSDAARFAEFVGTSRITAWYWLTGAARPSLLACLRIFFRFGRSFAPELIPRAAGAPVTRQSPMQRQLYLRVERRRRKIDWVAVRRNLRAQLRVPAGAAPSILAVARILHVAPLTLRAHEAALYRKIARRFLRRLRNEARGGLVQLRTQLLKVIKVLHRSGHEPTQKNVAAFLRQPGLFWRPDARRVLVAAKREFLLRVQRHRILAAT